MPKVAQSTISVFRVTFAISLPSDLVSSFRNEPNVKMKMATPNHGLAIAPVIDRSVDEGFSTRFQVYGSEHLRAQYTPKLTVQVRK